MKRKRGRPPGTSKKDVSQKRRKLKKEISTAKLKLTNLNKKEKILKIFVNESYSHLAKQGMLITPDMLKKNPEKMF